MRMYTLPLSRQKLVLPNGPGIMDRYDLANLDSLADHQGLHNRTVPLSPRLFAKHPVASAAPHSPGKGQDVILFLLIGSTNWQLRIRNARSGLRGAPAPSDGRGINEEKPALSLRNRTLPFLFCNIMVWPWISVVGPSSPPVQLPIVRCSEPIDNANN
ncbi:hypothetical protein BDY21DRAFT_107700 [Lineolata rhizophorae]|uniref:Uncharacterized protein n=1 Tax=Lineolata rhizophorae TaxID=578093 RepID=A0A6A6NRA4_9PEZI|nr:hypothetical protein BDY21DRAFT_107700 [Lineolata rhizophorae]